MKTIAFTVALFLSLQISYSQNAQNETYQFNVNLNKLSGSYLSVELITPKMNSDKALYRFPAMVPGTYSVYNFGRFIHNLKAYDENGKELTANKTDTNSWQIDGAAKLYKITYDVEPTYTSKQTNAVFEPVGTNIQLDTNYVINNHGFFGYFDGLIDSKYIVHFSKPHGFYGATSLNAIQRTDDEETFSSDGYHFLVDNPIMFSAADTASVSFDEANIMISVYSPGKGMKALDIAENMRKLLSAIRDYLGGRLPTDRYTFLFYFASGNGVSGANGALEHNQCSMYYMPDVPDAAKVYMLNQLISTCAHEFMHIVTPLTLHSEEIGNFDFNNPVMSEHLWLYEGVTEFSAHYIQLKEGLIDLKEYVDAINRELQGASRFNDTLPFTEMSLGALDKYKSQYQNVYEKGALIGLCLDVLIRHESGGKQGLKEVIAKLQEKYGKERSFKDGDLFGDITELTSPKVGEFFTNYVAGNQRLPYKEVLDYVGLNFESIPYEAIEFGSLRLGFDRKTFRMKLEEIDENNDFVKALGVKPGDELVSVDGKTVSFFNLRESFGSLKRQYKIGDDFKMEVARFDNAGKETIMKLQAKVTKTKTAYDSKVSINENPAPEQLGLRSVWMNK